MEPLLIRGTGTVTKTSVGNTDFLYVTSFSNNGTMNFNGGNLRVGGTCNNFYNTGIGLQWWCVYL
ncbi:MAG: hypothetical protein IPP25_21790 [Saprospiraceae bacterium]|nr:hypothetical protein [Candidatus Opimibacter skivensis]